MIIDIIASEPEEDGYDLSKDGPNVAPLECCVCISFRGLSRNLKGFCILHS